MTLATRCPACHTVFRVVPDQLRVSEGWVRCGRCGEAFNALEAMVDWPQPSAADPAAAPAPVAAAAPAAETPPPQAPPTMAPDVLTETPAHAPAPEPAAAEAVAFELPPGIEVVATDGAMAGALLTDVGPEPADAAAVPPDERAPRPAAQATGDLTAPASAAAAVEDAAAGADPQPPAPAPARAAEEALTAPSFVRQAERAARWRRPGVRVALGTASFLAALALAAQVVHAFRDRIAAASPAVRPWLQQACALAGCRVGDYRRIDALSVDGSALVRVDGAPVYRLSVTLRNRSDVEVAAPAFDLAVTDAQGRPIARRVLTMADLELPLRTLKPGTELPIQVPLGIQGAVSGYTVEIFYP